MFHWQTMAGWTHVRDTSNVMFHWQTLLVLARPYDPDFDSCCTVMLRDGTLVPYGYKEVDKALQAK
jgi:hypothetical protein